jgi:uncharacterized SAM-binding protein YcdF (DUF218 family)
MFFILSKTLGVLLRPSVLLILIGFIGLSLGYTRWRRAGHRLALFSLILLLMLGVFPVGTALLHVLESRFPKWDSSRGAPDGIVVLGGAISPSLSRDYGEPAITGNAGRILAIATLARAYPQARIIYSGGDGTLGGKGGAEADYLPPIIDLFGIAPARVTLESRSRNTVENAVFSKELAAPKPGERWLLVTSAQHMPRAIGVFRQAGFAIEAYPVAWQTGLRPDFSPSLNIVGNLSRLDAAAYEWVGLAAYWLTGKSAALFPAP